MKRFFPLVNKFITSLFNTRAAGLYILLFASSIAIATFIENDFGTSSAQKIIFKSWWFELLLLLFSITILVNMIKFKMIKQKKWTLLLFHLSIVIILIGAGITRYIGFEGMMHIRENSTSNSFLSSNTFLNFKVTKNDETYHFDEPVLFATLGNNNWHESFLIGNDLIDVIVKEFIPNPKQILDESIDGKPILKIVVAGINGREEYFIGEGETKRIRNIIYNFKENEIPEAINIKYENNSLLFRTNKKLTQMEMATQKKDTLYPSDNYMPLKLRSLYSDGSNNFVLAEFKESGIIKIESESAKIKSQSLIALLINISVNGKTKQAYLYGQKGVSGRDQILHFNDLHISVSYGAKTITLPFSIKLNKFILDKYPGTNSASSYASEVQLIDNRKNLKKDFRIYMNNILNYKGYRFFQSSFDKDEKGTYLSVNNDYWGTLISYIGYALLTLGMLLTFFSKKTRFYQVIQKIKKLRLKNSTFIFFIFFLSSSFSFSQIQKEDLNIKHVVNIDHANKFSRLIVQDYKGRMKPVHTLSSELLRKLSRKESLYGLSADQIILSMLVNSNEWYGVNIIKLGKHKDIQKKLGLTSEYASYKDFFLKNGDYKLRDDVRKVYNLNPIDRGVYEKELLKIDEKVNILSMVFSGSLLKIIPDPNGSDNSWVSNHDHSHNNDENSISDTFFSAYSTALKNAMKTNNYTMADKLVEELKDFQNRKGGAIMPSSTKINAEIFLNKSNVFSRLALGYMLLGIAFLFFLFLSVFKPDFNLKTAYTILFTFVVLGFIFHTIGLGLRWYISGRAPWSNGYESMIYIAWTSTLAGVIFTRKSFGGLAATMVLAATILLVSMLSFLDPEITPLVPVLKSYWLTIHVSLEAGSYGFLMLGAIIGFINLVLMIFLKDSNKIRMKRIIKEMSYISELTLIGGLFMVSIGTYLGGVWANESWGRYWGWDAKYYLSGLHSYATGDPIPVPKWVYIVVAIIIIISVFAYFKKKKHNLT
jgi:ABC-type transport system involved in cytochrome c biogenesis permease subunit